MGIQDLSRFRDPDDTTTTGFVPKLSFPRSAEPVRALCFDQALGNTGWAKLALVHGEPKVLDSGMVKTTESPGGGWEDSLQRGVSIFGEVMCLLGVPTRYDFVAHELPTVKARGQKKEGGAVAATALRCAHVVAMGFPPYSGDIAPVVMVNAQKVKKTFAGSARAEKRDVRRGVEQMLGEDVGKGLPYYNENVVDAIALGLVAFSEWQV